MEKYDAKKFSKHFMPGIGKFGAVLMPKHFVALEVLFISLVLTVVFLFSDTSRIADITALVALISYLFYRKWKKDLEADMEAENSAAKKKEK